MFDTIKFVIQEKDINYEMCFLEEIPCRISIEKCTGNGVIGHIKNIRIEVRVHIPEHTRSHSGSL